jgi:hypothetical protein
MSHTLPLDVGVVFAHCSAQAVAATVGADLLHIKGPAIDQSLLGAGGDLPRRRRSMDADVLVRPRDVGRFIDGMVSAGWRVAYPFEDGSPFTHAATMVHPDLPSVDVHRSFPGIYLEPREAFDRLWRDRTSTELGGIDCSVPAVSAQRLILLLHAVRSRSRGDIDRVWQTASDAERDAVSLLARELRSEVALAAAVGELERFRSHREYDLWRALRDGERSRPRLWLARVRAEPTWRRRVRTAVSLVRPKPARLARELGHPPTTGDRLRATSKLLRTAVKDVTKGRARTVTGRR